MMILTVLVSAFGYLWMNSANRQFQIVTQLSVNGEGIELGSPRSWFQFLPQSWLQYGGGHWCSPVERVTLPVIATGSNEARIDRLGESLKLTAQLSALTSLQIESLPSLDHQRDLKETFEPLANIRGLRSLSLDINSSLNPLLDAMPALPKLATLELSTKDSKSVAGLSQLNKFPRLRTLTFESDVLEADGLKLLAECKQTRILTARDSLFTADEMECLRGHPSLEYFISSSTMTDEALEVLGTIPKLRSIFANGSLITDVGLSHLANLKDLEDVSLDGTTITDVGLAQLSNCRLLKKLSCVGCRITDAAGPTLSRFSQLRSLDLKQTQVTGKVLSHLIPMKKLKYLGFEPNSAHIDDLVQFAISSVSYPKDEQQSRYSWAALNYRFNPNYVANIATQVNPLYLSGLMGVSRRMQQIRDVRAIALLNLSHTDVDDQDMKDLASLCTPYLIEIDNTSVTPLGLNYLLNHAYPSYLKVGPFEDNEEATEVIAKFSNLQSLTLVGTNELSRKAKDSLLRLSSLSTLHLTDLPFEEAFARELCKLPNIADIQWCDEHWNLGKIEDERLRRYRERYPGRAGMYLYTSKRAQPYIPAITIVSAQELGGVPYTGELNASGVAFTKQNIAELTHEYDLATLNLSRTGATDDMLGPLSRLSRLTTLDLSSNAISGSTIPTIFKSPPLETLSLASTQITDQSLANLLANLQLRELDISNTRITEQAWNQSPSVKRTHRLQKIDLRGIPALPQILNRFKDMPSELTPKYVSISQGFYILTSNLKFLSGETPSNDFFKLEITPEMLQIWQLEGILGGKRLINELTTSGTNDLASILPMCKRECPLLCSLAFEHEQLDPVLLSGLPSQIRELKLIDCTLTTESLEAITRACPHLVSIVIDSCKLESCSLEPLTKTSWLSSLAVTRTELTSHQRNVLKRLRNSVSVSR